MKTFADLSPSLVLEAVSSQGFAPTGALLSLNSYENRVYDVALKDEPSVVAKFYRSGRWPLPAIVEEHRFMAALEAAEVPIVAPFTLLYPLTESSTLAQLGDFIYAIFPRFRGRERPDLRDEDRKLLGKVLARLHNIGSQFDATHRPTLDPESYGYGHLDFILSQPLIPSDLRSSIDQLLTQALDMIDPFFMTEMEIIPLHGDCHLGNILWNRDNPYLVDFDDMVIAPPIQDMWMLWSGTKDEVKHHQAAFFSGYETIRHFDHNTLILTEPLRTLRMIHHCAWIGRRYHDPAFQHAFPYYQDRRYWESFLLSIKEQIALLQVL